MALENGQFIDDLPIQKWWFSIAMLVYWRVYITPLSNPWTTTSKEHWAGLLKFADVRQWLAEPGLVHHLCTEIDGKGRLYINIYILYQDLQYILMVSWRISPCIGTAPVMTGWQIGFSVMVRPWIFPDILWMGLTENLQNAAACTLKSRAFLEIFP